VSGKTFCLIAKLYLRLYSIKGKSIKYCSWIWMKCLWNIFLSAWAV
jgi:hypothetical protein